MLLNISGLLKQTKSSHNQHIITPAIQCGMEQLLNKVLGEVERQTIILNASCFDYVFTVLMEERYAVSLN